MNPIHVSREMHSSIGLKVQLQDCHPLNMSLRYFNGEYVGGFTELCNEMAIPKTIMDVAILDIGGKPNMKKYNAHSWNNHTANNRVNAGVLTEDFFTAPPISHLSAPKRTVSAPVVSSKPKENNNLISKEGDKAKTDVPSPPEEKKMDA